MEFNVKIKSMKQWFRESTNDWCICVVVQTDNANVAITYSGKTLDRARKSMLKSLPEDILRTEIEYRKEELLNNITEE